MGTLVSRTKAPATTSLSLWWEIVADVDASRSAARSRPGQGGAPAAVCRLPTDVQVSCCLTALPRVAFFFLVSAVGNRSLYSFGSVRLLRRGEDVSSYAALLYSR